MLRLAASFIATALILAGCAAPPPPQEAFPFEVAIRTLTMNEMAEFRSKSAFSPLRQIAAAASNPAAANRSGNTMMLDPFVISASGEVTDSSSRAATIIGEIVTGAPNNMQLVPLNSKGFSTASYIMVGKLTYEPYYNSGIRHYRAYASVIDISTGDVLSSSNVWIADAKLPSRPTGLYARSPMFLKDKALQRLLDAAQAPSGSNGGRAYVADLEAALITADATDALNGNDLQTAITLYNKSISLPAGHTMKNYAGLYTAYVRQGRMEDAGRAYTELFALAAQNGNPGVKFLFIPGSTEFNTKFTPRAEYDLWLRQSARYIATSPCRLAVVGHASHTGDENFNVVLSRNRANTISEYLKASAPSIASRLRTDGKGWHENQVGSGTDDDQDSVDRRVEFALSGC